ncbi:hypothetical protein [Hymenobacter latericus]|uniref:hypothetical protein n=1 Tax=Hymenobacter sp. YIM 151858-1 TaxID=2987688 RepID=UPI002226D785|nr:hypothetical protein [Hymenobacter sp. YIM 151858-1]UYZ59615.1 hypothetical protein OIS50_02180 [Hymenobacter sp. YIM 151858-1]
MSKLLALLTGGLLLVGAAPAWAQQRESETGRAEQRLAEEIGLDRLPASAPSPLNANNVATLHQQGVGNHAQSVQNNPGLLSNLAYIRQVGAGNEAQLSQTGSGNRSSVHQRGSRNRVASSVVGNDNEIEVVQRGSQNVVSSEVVNDGRQYTILQQGSNNRLNQVETSPASPKGYTVEMRGNGINITIEQGKAW